MKCTRRLALRTSGRAARAAVLGDGLRRPRLENVVEHALTASKQRPVRSRVGLNEPSSLRSELCGQRLNGKAAAVACRRPGRRTPRVTSSRFGPRQARCVALCR